MTRTTAKRGLHPLLILTLALAGCDESGALGDEADDGAPDVEADTATAPPETQPVADAAPATESYTTWIGDWTMRPGEETTRCVHKRLDNDEPIWVTSIDTRLAPGSHHLIVYRSSVTDEDAEPTPCTPFVDVIGGEAYPLMISQIAEETLQLPEGVALKLEPNQMIRLEAHYLNYLPGEITAHADVTFNTVPESEVEAEAGLMLYGTPDISIGAGRTYTTPWYYLPVWEGRNVFAATGHTHRFGLDVELRKGGTAQPTGLGNEPVQGAIQIYPGEEPFAWDEAPVVFYDPPLHFGANEGVQYRCTWKNTSNQWVGFGESANEEMCFFWLYYYPSQGYRLCINLGSWYERAEGLVEPVECCPDSRVCPAVKAFLESGFRP